MLLFSRNIEEEFVAFDRTTKGNAGLHAAKTQATGWGRIGERFASIEPLVLEEGESITMKFVLPHSGDDVDCATCRAAELRRLTVIHDLELAHDFRREGNPSCPGRLIGIVQTINRYRVAARAQPAEGESAVGQRRAGARIAASAILLVGGSDSRCQQRELEIVAAINRQLLNALRID